jgi:HTH domain
MVFVPGKYANQPDEEWVSPDILAIRKYQAEIDRLNASPQPVVEAEAVPEVLTVKPRKLTELQKAKAFLSDVLSGEPMLATTVQELAVEVGISRRTLRRAVKALKVKVRKNGRGPWFWGMVRTELESGQDAKVAG